MRSKNHYPFMLLALFLILYILPLGARDLLVPDEPRYAEIPREMIASGDWAVPHLNGLRYFEKPPLGYWVSAGALLLFGENNFAVRLPSALATGLSALLIYGLMSRIQRRQTHEENWPAALAAFVFLTASGVAGIGHIAVLDSLFSFFLTAAIISFFGAAERQPGSAAEKKFLFLSGVACGLAFLTKGFLAFVVPILAVAPYLVWQRRYRDLLRMSVVPLLSSLLVALPWSVWIHLREPDFWRFFFWNEHIRRFLSGTAQHKASFWFFFVAAPLMCLPWTLLIPPSLRWIRAQIDRRDSRQSRSVQLSLCWLVLPFLFFSFSKGKLLTYILPCFPPFAILLSSGLAHAFERGNSKAIQRGLAGAVILFGLTIPALVCVQFFGSPEIPFYRQASKLWIAAIGLMALVLFCWAALRSQHPRRKALLLGLSPVLLFVLAGFALPDSVLEQSAPGRFLAQHQREINADTLIITCQESVDAVCWQFRRNDVYLLIEGGELDYGLTYGDAAGRRLDVESASRLIQQNRGRVVLIARGKRIRRWRDQLPTPSSEETSGTAGYVLWQY